jgi:hypothetical protein
MAACRAGEKSAFRLRPNLPFFPLPDPLIRPAAAAGRAPALPSLSGGMSEAIPPERPGRLRPRGLLLIGKRNAGDRP